MMPQYILRFADLYDRQGRHVAIMDNKLWVNYGRMIVPIGPIHRNYSLTEHQAQRLIKKIPGALMVRYTYDFQEADGSEEWYAVISDNFNDLKSYKHENRRAIKRGLENCVVRQVDAEFIAKHGYEVYTSAFSRYKELIAPISLNNYAKMIDATKAFDDIYHYWAVFNKEKLIGYSVIALYGDEEADISVIKLNPNYLNLYPGNALFYSINKQYIQNNSFHYLNAGFRSLYHKTNVHDFLIKKLLFRKAYLKLGIVYSQPFSYLLKLSSPFKGLLSKANPKLKAMYMLQEIGRSADKFPILDRTKKITSNIINYHTTVIPPDGRANGN